MFTQSVVVYRGDSTASPRGDRTIDPGTQTGGEGGELMSCANLSAAKGVLRASQLLDVLKKMDLLPRTRLRQRRQNCASYSMHSPSFTTLMTRTGLQDCASVCSCPRAPRCLCRETGMRTESISFCKVCLASTCTAPLLTRKLERVLHLG